MLQIVYPKVELLQGKIYYIKKFASVSLGLKKNPRDKTRYTSTIIMVPARFFILVSSQFRFYLETSLNSGTSLIDFQI